MTDKLIASLTVAQDGFLYWKGLKIQARLVEGGLEFFDRDPRRAARCGSSQLFVVPFAAFLALVETIERKDGER